MASSHHIVRYRAAVKYVALSYCWGDEQTVEGKEKGGWQRIMQGYTIDSNVRTKPFSSESLPETIRDAIAITYNLGSSYIWTDSVCVPKGTWHAEANRMHEVYGNACFTLSSNATSTAIDRMLQPQAAWRDQSRGCRLYDPWLLNTDMPLDEVRLRSPVAKRGWILQEERLSPRVMYWCSQRAHWSCAECQKIEARQPGKSWPSGRSILSPPQKFMQLCRGGDRDQLRREWCDIVTAYARRSLSEFNVVDNRFAAFAGLAVRYLSASSSPNSQDEYLAGLWRKTIATDLLWSVKTASAPSAILSSSVPSWSWLSLPVRTEMCIPASLHPSSAFRLLTPRHAVEDANDVEVVAKGATVKTLTVSGRLRPFIADAEAVLVPWSGIERPSGFDFSDCPSLSMYSRHEDGRVLVYEPHREEVVGKPDYVADSEMTEVSVPHGCERKILCLEVGKKGMVLLRRTEGAAQEGFKRVGVCVGYRDGFFEGCGVETVELV